MSKQDLLIKHALECLQDTNDMTGGTPIRNAVLVVEDDPILKWLTVDLVQAAGFVVLEAGNAAEAVAILEARSDIALLLTDINMPGSMDGLKLAHAVRDRWPPIRIIVVSSRAPVTAMPLDCRFVSKPYHADKMVSEIRSLIGG